MDHPFVQFLLKLADEVMVIFKLHYAHLKQFSYGTRKYNIYEIFLRECGTAPTIFAHKDAD